MPRYRSALFVVLLILTAGCVLGGSSAADVTVRNEDAQRYTMTVYVLEEPASAGNITFQATNESGVQKTVSRLELETEGPYYDVALTEDWDATEHHRAIPADETVRASFDSWAPGTALVYVFESADGQHVRTTFAECSRQSVRHTFVFSEGPQNGHEMQCSPD